MPKMGFGKLCEIDSPYSILKAKKVMSDSKTIQLEKFQYKVEKYFKNIQNITLKFMTFLLDDLRLAS